MSVVIETTLGDITVDLYISDRPRTCLNFLKLCAVKYYNYNLFHTISRGFIAQTGDPTGSRNGGESIYGVLDGPLKRYFESENEPRMKHTKMGLISFVGNEDGMIGSQFFITLGEDLTYLDEKHCIFGEVVEGFDVLEVINEVICDTDDRPYQDVRITHTVILNDPFPQPKRLLIPSRSPSPSRERLQGGRIAPDEEIDETEGKTIEEVSEMQAEQEAKARATILEMVGDIPDADIAPPENVLFVCKLNPVTTDDDLEVIFNRFGKIKSCEVIRDLKTGDSLQYAFIEFEEQKSCEDAYFKMDNILIDDRRIHVDFSQSVSKVRWLGKGRGVAHYDDRGNVDSNIGKGKYKLNTSEKKYYKNHHSDDNQCPKIKKYDQEVTKSDEKNRMAYNNHRETSKRDLQSAYRRKNYSPKDSGGSKKRDGSHTKSSSNYSNSRNHRSSSSYKQRNESSSRRNSDKSYSNTKRCSLYDDEDNTRKKTNYNDRRITKKQKESKTVHSSDDSDSEDKHKRRKSYEFNKKVRHSDEFDEDKGYNKKKYRYKKLDRNKKISERKYSPDTSDSDTPKIEDVSNSSDDSERNKNKRNMIKKKSKYKSSSSSDSDYRKTKKLKK